MTGQAQASRPDEHLTDAVLRVEILWGDQCTFEAAVQRAARDAGVDEAVLRKSYIDQFNATRPYFGHLRS